MSDVQERALTAVRDKLASMTPVERARRIPVCAAELTLWKREDGKDRWAALSHELNLLRNLDSALAYAAECVVQAARLSALEAELAALRKVAEWQPIETVPPAERDEQYDVWLVPPAILEKNAPYRMRATWKGLRVPNAFRRGGHWCEQQGTSSMNIAGRWFYDDEGDECFDPDDTSSKAYRVTHWRAVLSGPGVEGGT